MEDTIVEIVPDECNKHIYAPNLSVHIRPFVTLFDAYHACRGFEIS